MVGSTFTVIIRYNAAKHQLDKENEPEKTLNSVKPEMSIKGNCFQVIPPWFPYVKFLDRWI